MVTERTGRKWTEMFNYLHWEQRQSRHLHTDLHELVTTVRRNCNYVYLDNSLSSCCTRSQSSNLVIEDILEILRYYQWPGQPHCDLPWCVPDILQLLPCWCHTCWTLLNITQSLQFVNINQGIWYQFCKSFNSYYYVLKHFILSI